MTVVSAAAETTVIGSVCSSGEPTDPSCYDVNPAALHVVMANYIGLQGRGFYMDVDPTYEKWNQPVFAYA